MPRYLVQRTFPEGLEIPTNDNAAKTCLVADPYFYTSSVSNDG